MTTWGTVLGASFAQAEIRLALGLSVAPGTLAELTNRVPPSPSELQSTRSGGPLVDEELELLPGERLGVAVQPAAGLACAGRARGRWPA